MGGSKSGIIRSDRPVFCFGVWYGDLVAMAVIVAVMMMVTLGIAAMQARCWGRPSFGGRYPSFRLKILQSLCMDRTRISSRCLRTSMRK